MDTISVVVPFLNEESCIIEFCKYIDTFALDKPYNLEIIFVDDGSSDETVTMLSQFSFTNCYAVKLVRFSKNFGSHSAARAGFLRATGEYCTFMGVDLQEPDNMLDVMYSRIITGYDAIYIEKKSVEVNFFNRIFSILYSDLMKKFAVKNYGSGGVNNIMFNSKIRDYLNENIELNSSLNLQIIDAGFKSNTIEMDYKIRTAGRSKWTVSKKIKLFIDSFIAFSYAPIRAVSILGISMAILGFLYGAYIVTSKLLHPELPASGFATLASLLLFGFGVTNISLGIIAEYLWRAYDVARGRPAFIISETQNLK